MGLLSNGGRERNKIWHNGSLGDEDDAQTSNTCIAQSKFTIPHATMENNRRSIIECCNKYTHCHISANKRVLALPTSMMLVTLLVCITLLYHTLETLLMPC